jgi:oligo-alginate lyase
MQRRDFIKASFAFGSGLTAPEVLAQLSSPAPPVSSASLTASASAVWSGKPLFFLPERIAVFQNRIANDATMRARWKKFLKRADALIDETNTKVGDFPGQMGLILGLAWRVTGDERYANKLRETSLKNVSADLKPGADADNHTPMWHSWLQTASLVANCAVSREALEGFLSIAERKQITEGMMRLGIQPLLEDWVLPENRIHALDSMGHNWWSVCISGTGIGVLALLGEDSRAMDWLIDIETALAEWFDYRGMVLLNKTQNFDPTGAFYESVGYAGYALEFYLAFRLARTNAVTTPPQSIPVLDQMAKFFANTLYPASTGDLAVNFGDSSLKPHAMSVMQMLSILGFSQELTHWYLQREDPASIDPLALLYLDDTVTPGNSLSPSVIYPTIGWAMLRDSWEENSTLLAIKSGFTWNHAHADAGSFVLYHDGQPLLIDSGSCGYSRREYLDYYCQSQAHNVVLFNGQGQPLEDFHDRGVKFPGRVHDLLDGLDVKYVYADATGPMARYFTRNYRHWLWIDGVVLVIDDIRAFEEGRFDWLLHYAGEARASGATVELSNGAANASLTMLYPSNPIITEETGLAADAPDKKIKYLKLSTPTNAREQKFIVAIVPMPNKVSVSSPTVELLREKDALGVRITGKEEITDVYLNLMADGRRMHANSINNINGWETDAYLLALTRPAKTAADIENITRYFVAGCSYLRRNGQSALDSFSKINAIVRPGENIEVLLHGQPQVEMSIVCLKKPATLRINKNSAPFKYFPDQRTIRFRAETSKGLS